MSRRVPPGGRSTIVFGTENSSAEKQDERIVKEESEAQIEEVGITPEQVEVIKGLVEEAGDVEDLIYKLQTDILGISPEATEGDEIATRAFKPPAAKVSGAIEALHHALAQRGTDSLVLLGKKFHIMDNDGNKGVCYEEFKQGLRETGVHVEEAHCQALFRTFDADCSGYISFDEFLSGVRPKMNERRSELVTDVFSSMDVNNDGALTVQDVSGKYDCSLHPDVRVRLTTPRLRCTVISKVATSIAADVVAGSRTEVEVLQTFLAGFDGSLGQKSGIVTQDKFLSYYSAVSASVDDDEYFELILRNTWHLPGAGDTTCRRLLVTKEDGTQSIEEIEDDIDITKEDLQAIRNKLREQGVPVLKVALYGYVESPGTNILSTSMSPRKATKSANGSRPATAETPDDAVAAYKQRMSTSNVTFS